MFRTPCNFNAIKRVVECAMLLALRASFAIVMVLAVSQVTSADHLRLTDGTTIEVDEAWEDAQGIWYRRGGVTHLIERARVRSIERTQRAEKTVVATDAKSTIKVVEAGAVKSSAPETPQPV